MPSQCQLQMCQPLGIGGHGMMALAGDTETSVPAELADSGSASESGCTAVTAVTAALCAVHMQ